MWNFYGPLFQKVERENSLRDEERMRPRYASGFSSLLGRREFLWPFEASIESQEGYVFEKHALVEFHLDAICVLEDKDGHIAFFPRDWKKGEEVFQNVLH